MPSQHIRHTAKMMGLACAVTLAGCAQTPPIIKYVPKEVLVAKDAPCPKDKGTIPVRPKRVSEEHPVMPRNAVPEPVDPHDYKKLVDYLTGEVNASHQRERILGSKVLELTTFAEKADGVMRACAGQPDMLATGLR